MNQYKFDEKYSRKIVEAIVEGYRDYIEHRKDQARKMTISTAFTWTKGNFIESKIAEFGSDLNLTYKRAKAGLTWDYLQFIQGDTKKLFLIKNAAYFDVNNFSKAVLPTETKKTGIQRTYLHELSTINKGLEFLSSIEPEEENQQETMDSIQLSLFMPEKFLQEELTEFKDAYQEFHILTYRIDESYQISEVMHYLPNPDDNKAYKIEDLSDYISGAELDEEDRQVIAPEPAEGLIDPSEFDIGIIEEDKQNEENN